MVDEVDRAVWKQLSSALVTVRDLVRKQNRGAVLSEERAALAKVASHAGFDGLGPQAMSPQDRGRWIVARVRERLVRLADDQETEDLGARDSPARRAIRCWAAYVDEGLSPTGLYDAHPEFVPSATPATTPTARRGRVQSLMWAGGARPDKDSEAGVHLIAHELRAALLTDVPDGTGLDEISFDYEWRRLVDGHPASADLLKVLAFLGPDEPVPLPLLRKGGDLLPKLVTDLCERPDRLRSTCAALRDRGLAVLHDGAVRIDRNTSEQVRRHVPVGQHPDWAGLVVRFLGVALPSETHHSATWDAWRSGMPHVLVAAAAAEEDQVELTEAVYLLDRASVYWREALSDGNGAVKLAEHALALSDESGQNDAELHATCQANLAMAHRAAGRLSKAARYMRESVDFTAATMGTDNESYAESLNIYAAILAAWDRPRQAEQAFTESLDILRRVYADKQSDDVCAALVETLNDYAGFQLTDRPGGPRGKQRLTIGIRLLQEASALLRRGEYGWSQITLNLGKASRAAGEFDSAEQYLREVIDYCENTPREPSIRELDAVLQLAELYEQQRKPGSAKLRRRAHAIDKRLQAMATQPG